MSKKNPTISLCMIVKDEEKFLEQCLESVKHVVDEMIIVDTGSTDRTVEIAKRYVDKVYFYEWQGSFSDARNYGLQFATSDWILQLDADEELRQADIPELKKVIRTNKFNAIFVALMNETPAGWTKHYFQRIFRRGRAKFEGIVHNQLVYEGPVLQTEIIVYHYGYNLSPDEMKKKLERTKSMLLKQLETDDTNPFSYMNLMRVLKTQGKHAEVITLGKTAYEKCSERMTAAIRQMIDYDLICSLIEENNVKEAEEKARCLLAEFPDNLDIHYGLGHALMKQRKFEEALVIYNSFISIIEKEADLPKINLLIVDTYTLVHRVWAIISDCNFELKRFEDGFRAAQKAVALKPKIAEYKIALIRNLCELQRTTEAEDVLADMANNTLDENIYLKTAALMQKYPALGSALHKMEEGLEVFPDSIPLLDSLANICCRTELDKAEAAWKKIYQMQPEHAGANIGLAKLYIQREDRKNLPVYREFIIETIQDENVLHELAANCVQYGCYDFAVELYTKYLMSKPEDSKALTDIATCYAYLGNYRAALAGYKEVLKSDPHNQLILKNLAAIQKIVEKAQKKAEKN